MLPRQRPWQRACRPQLQLVALGIVVILLLICAALALRSSARSLHPPTPIAASQRTPLPVISQYVFNGPVEPHPIQPAQPVPSKVPELPSNRVKFNNEPKPILHPLERLRQSTLASSAALSVAVSTRQLPASAFLFQETIPVVVFTFNRAASLLQTLNALFKVLPKDGYRVFVSQDGDDAEVRRVIQGFNNKVTHLEFHYTDKPDPSYSLVYQKIASHYNFALTQVFHHQDVEYNRVILLEDDMEFAPDTFAYFRSLAPLFDTDSKLYCVSAWNDNGQPQLVHDPSALYRTDCFPGLGWMWSRALWLELGHGKWTWGFWDDWLREQKQRKDRSCIYPEINRVKTFGAMGASAGQFYDRYLKGIRLNEQDVQWHSIDHSSMQWRSYRKRLMATLRSTELRGSVKQAQLSIDAELQRGTQAQHIAEQRVLWNDLGDLTNIIAPLEMIPDHKAGVPRTSFEGVLQFRYKSVRIYLVHQDSAMLAS